MQPPHLKGAVMTEGFRSPPQSPTGPGYAGAAAARQDAVDTVQRILGEDRRSTAATSLAKRRAS